MKAQDKLPPHSEDLEASFLGCLLMGNRDANQDTLSAYPDAAGFFYIVAHQTVFSAIRDLVEANEPVDCITVKALLEKRGTLADAGGSDLITSLPDRAPSSWNAPYYADQLRELFTKRRALAACQKVSEQALNGCTQAELLETIERELNGIAFQNAVEEPGMKTLVQSCITDIEQAHATKGTPQGITTGLCDLDRLTHGLRPGQLFIIGARPGEGKTSLAANIAEHVAMDCHLPVGFIELEMTAKELTLRLLSSRSQVPLDRLLSGSLVQEHFRQMAVASAAIAKAPLFIADEDGITIGQLKAKARRLHRKHKLSLLIVDYLQLVRPSRPNPSRNVEVSEISSSLKALAKELNVPLIALSQLNRDSDTDNREPRLRDLRDSGSIEQDADIVGLLHRPKPDEDLITLNILKHRQGPKRKLNLVFFGEVFRFQPAATEVRK